MGIPKFLADDATEPLVECAEYFLMSIPADNSILMIHLVKVSLDIGPKGLIVT